MIKKIIALCMAIAVAISATACGGASSGSAGGGASALSGTAQIAEGTVMNATQSTMILKTDDGKEWSFPLDGAQITAPDGLISGLRVIVHYTGTAQGADISGLVVHKVEQIATAPEQDYAVNTAASSSRTNSTVDGWIVDASMNNMVLETPSGRTLVFFTGDAQIEAEDGIVAGLWVRVTYDGYIDGTNTENAAVTRVDEIAGLTDTYMAAGRIEAVGMDAITLHEEQTGVTLSFLKGNAEVIASDGIQVGAAACIYYTGTVSGEDTSRAMAVRIVVTAPPQPEKPVVRYYAVAGVVSGDSSMNNLIIYTADGRCLKFSTQDAVLHTGSVGIVEGAHVNVTYTGSIRDEDTSHAVCTEVDVTAGPPQDTPQPTDATHSVAGQITDIGMSTFTLLANDGRTLSFGKDNVQLDLNDGLFVGLWVRVYYTGWISGSDTANAVAVEVGYMDN